MFQHAFGDPTWSKGLRFYLNNREYNFAEPEHLYEGIQEAANEDNPSDRLIVSVAMRSWEEQPGFPYVQVLRNGNQLTFVQNRFMYANRVSTSLWWIPINYVVSSNPDFTETKADMWLQGATTTTIQSGSTAPKPFSEADWIVVNIQQTAYYRVNYDNALWNQIIAQLKNDFEKIHLFNRAQLIDDSFHFARADLLNYETHFMVLNYLEKETDYVPWASANHAYKQLSWWISGSNIFPRYQAFMAKNVRAFYESLGASSVIDENRINRYARIMAINIACESQLESCLTETNQRLQTMLDTGIPIERDLDKAIYCNGIRIASETTYRQLQNSLPTARTESERADIIAGLGCTQNSSLLIYIHTYAMAASSVLTNEERSYLLISSPNPDETMTLNLIQFVRPNYAALIYYASVQSVCDYLANRISTQLLLSEFVSLLDYLQSRSALTPAQVSAYINIANNIIAWQITYLDSVEKFFSELDLTTTAAPSTVQSTISIEVTTTQSPTTSTAGTTLSTTILPTQSTTSGASSVTFHVMIIASSMLLKCFL